MSEQDSSGLSSRLEACSQLFSCNRATSSRSVRYPIVRNYVNVVEQGDIASLLVAQTPIREVAA